MTSWLGCERREVGACGSTNDLALAWAKDRAPHGAVVVADAQSAGRGRHGRVWASPAGRNLYASIVVRVGGGIPVAPITLAIGVGLCDAIRGEGVVGAGLKWPNDVLVGGRKVAGVLCEAAADVVIVGVGVNTNGRADELPAEIAARATTIGDELGRWVDRAAFLDRVLAELEPWIDRYLAGGVAAIAPAWQDRMLAGLGVRTDRATGRAIGLDLDGALRIESADGAVHRVISGEVEWIG